MCNDDVVKTGFHSSQRKCSNTGLQGNDCAGVTFSAWTIRLAGKQQTYAHRTQRACYTHPNTRTPNTRTLPRPAQQACYTHPNTRTLPRPTQRACYTHPNTRTLPCPTHGPLSSHFQFWPKLQMGHSMPTLQTQNSELFPVYVIDFHEKKYVKTSIKFMGI